MSYLTFYWFEETVTSFPQRFGVTAYSVEDAFGLLRAHKFDFEKEGLRINTITSVAQLEQNHVAPNIGLITRRGIWFPNLNTLY